MNDNIDSYDNVKKTHSLVHNGLEFTCRLTGIRYKVIDNGFFPKVESIGIHPRGKDVAIDRTFPDGKKTFILDKVPGKIKKVMSEVYIESCL